VARFGTLLRRSDKYQGYVVWQIQRDSDDSNGAEQQGAASPASAVGGSGGGRAEAQAQARSQLLTKKSPSKLASKKGIYGRLAPERPLPKVQSLPALREVRKDPLAFHPLARKERHWDLRC
jgi:hypothetical protein